MMTEDQLRAIEARAEAATAGPWYWRTGEKFTTRLISAKNMGQYVMTFIRRGMQSADVRFNVNGIMRSAHTISVPRREGDPDWDERTLDHPDAVFIAHARADIPALVAEVRRLRARVEALDSVQCGRPEWSVCMKKAWRDMAVAAVIVADSVNEYGRCEPRTYMNYLDARKAFERAGFDDNEPSASLTAILNGESEGE